jgi:hypothetical protein
MVLGIFVLRFESKYEIKTVKLGKSDLVQKSHLKFFTILDVLLNSR